ncbi:MAG: hypothetical protein PVJ01_05755 [Pseudomonadota bacterium]|jgi:hypothetical protein
MQRLKWSILLALGLLSTSALIYTLHYLVFGDLGFLTRGWLASLAFVPIQGLVVTLIIAELMVIMSRGARMQKMNMVIGVFFSELGTELLRYLYVNDPQATSLRETFETAGDLSAKEVAALRVKVGNYPFRVNLDRQALGDMRKMLTARRDFMVRLLENPSLLENENFTSLLWAIFHLTEELDARADLNEVPESDFEHLKGDISRSYGHLFREWLSYMRHLHDHYPFLYSFAMRTSPIEPEVQVEVV